MRLRWIDSKSKQMQEVLIDLQAILQPPPSENRWAAPHYQKSAAQSVSPTLLYTERAEVAQQLAHPKNSCTQARC